MSASESYIEAAMVACPKCRAAAGDPCWVWACRNGSRFCDYKACAYRKELPEPHLQRAVAARKATQPVERGDGDGGRA